MLKVNHVCKQVRTGNEDFSIIDDINLETKDGEMVAICGHSGSGKSTLLGIMSGIDCPTKGEVWFNDINLYLLKKAKLAKMRNKYFGIVFQNYNLIKGMTAFENVEIPQLLAAKEDRKKKNPLELLELVGLHEKAKTKVSYLSGGEQQRISIARALAQEPSIIFADEPTGALDYENSQLIMNLFLKIKKELKVSIILVTHEKEIAKFADRIVMLDYGNIKNISVKKNE